MKISKEHYTNSIIFWKIYQSPAIQAIYSI